MVAIFLVLIGALSVPVHGLDTSEDLEQLEVIEAFLRDDTTDNAIAAASAMLRKIDRGQGGLDHLKKVLRGRLAKPTGDNLRAIGEGYRYLFWDAVDREENSEVLVKLFRGLVAYEGNNLAETFADAPLALLERTGEHAIAESAIQKALREVDLGSHNSARLHIALGKILTEQGKFDAALALFNEAEKSELESHGETLNAFWYDPKSLDLLLYRGDLYSMRGEVDAAERQWKRALSVKVQAGLSIDETDPFAERIRKARLATGRDPNYLVEFLGEEEPQIRKRRILETAITQDVRVSSFFLKSLTGERVSLEAVLGKVVVINSWATFCAPCIRELPDLERLAGMYADDSGVTFLTMATDRDTSVVSRWVRQTGMRLPVLLDDFSGDLDILRGLPQTTFIDRDGNIRFRVAGSREHLIEEFAWRIDLLKGQK